MKLSTFFSLIHGNVFIPSLKTLCRNEPKEGFLPMESPSSDHICVCIEEKSGLKDSESWLLKKATEEDRIDLEGRKHSSGGYIGVLLRILYAQLQNRRAVWCWHHSDSESMAMWNIYAHQGVAIRSSVAKIEAALGLADEWEIYAGSTTYKQPGWQDHEYCRDISKVLKRPFMFKSADYEHEKEVRLFFKINPADGPDKDNGIRVPIDPVTLIDEIVLSPFIHDDEQNALEHIFREIFHETKIQIRASTGLRRYSVRNDFLESVYSFSPCPSLYNKIKEVAASLLPQTSNLERIPFVEEQGLPDLLRQL